MAKKPRQRLNEALVLGFVLTLAALLVAHTCRVVETQNQAPTAIPQPVKAP